MRKELRELLRGSKKINLDMQEKNRIRDSLLLYLKDHPAKEAEVSPWSFIGLFLNPVSKLVAICLIVILGFGTIATVAAENALPGEFLHPVKIKVNENIRSFLARSSYAKADWEIERANRRLVEIEKLADSGKLNAETVKEAEKRFENHLQKASEAMARVEAKEGEDQTNEMKSTVGALLLVHQDVLREMGQGSEKREMKEEIKTELGNLQENVKGKLKEANENLFKEKEEAHRTSVSPRALGDSKDSEKEEKEQRILPQSAAEGKLKSAENKIEEVKKFFDLKRNKVGPDVILEAERLLQLAQDSISEGKTKINVGDNNDAFTLFQKAILLAQTSQRLLSLAQEILPAGNLNLEEKIKTEGDETKFEIRIEIRNGQEEEDEAEAKNEVKGESIAGPSNEGGGVEGEDEGGSNQGAGEEGNQDEDESSEGDRDEDIDGDNEDGDNEGDNDGEDDNDRDEDENNDNDDDRDDDRDNDDRDEDDEDRD